MSISSTRSIQVSSELQLMGESASGLKGEIEELKGLTGEDFKRKQEIVDSKLFKLYQHIQKMNEEDHQVPVEEIPADHFCDQIIELFKIYKEISNQ